MGKRKRSNNDVQSQQAQSLDKNSLDTSRKATASIKSSSNTSIQTSGHPHRNTIKHSLKASPSSTSKSVSASTSTSKSTLGSAPNDPLSSTIQIIAGSYDRILHGFTAEIDFSKVISQNENDVQDAISFTDTFLFNAHSSAIRCLALSPITTTAHHPGTDVSSKILLASGGTDERINLYSLSAHAPLPSKERAPMPSAFSVTQLENPKNREVGSLLHHSSTVTSLRFAKSKLISASEDNTVAISRIRDWTLMTAMKAPIPQAHGRPSGDTAAPGKTPAGVNDFDVDPSAKILISVGRGERCMRLWNLVTGKRANTLNFDKNILHAIGEAKFHSGEGRKIIFEPDGDGFVVAFEYAAVMFDMQLGVVGLAVPAPKTKIHQIRFVAWNSTNTLAISTEDGRILLFNTQSMGIPEQSDQAKNFAKLRLIGQIGGPTAGVPNRIKDFEALTLGPNSDKFFVSAGSDGSVRIWHLGQDEVSEESTKDTHQLGRLLGRFDTANRITCIKAFAMLRASAKPSSNTNIETKAGPVDLNEENAEEEFQGFE